MENYTYYVGDLCYVLDTDQWFTACARFWVPDSDGDYDPEGFLRPGDFSWEDESAAHPFYIFNTAYGDGFYSDQDGRQYSVDSGTIGAIRTDYADPEKLADAVARGLGHLHEFDDDFGASSCGNDDGTLWFDTATGTVEIQTGDSYTYEEEEEDDSDDSDEDDG